MRGPLRDRDRIFPILDRRTVFSGQEDEIETDVKDSIPHFESVEDLPESPMLRNYVSRLSNHLNKAEEEIINSEPVRDYMKKLGVWESAKQQNV